MRRLRRVLTRTLLALLVLAVAAYLLRDRLLARPLARLVAARLGEALSGEIRIERIEGTWFTGVTLVGVDGRIPEGSFSCARAEVRYALPGLLGERPQDAIRAVTLEDARADLDLSGPAAGPTEPSAPFDPVMLLDVLPARWPRVAVEASLRLRLGGDATVGGELALHGGDEVLDLVATGLTLPEVGPVDRFAGRLERSSRDALLWTSEEEWGGVRLASVALGTDGHLRVEAFLGGGRVDAALRMDGGHFEARDVHLVKIALLEGLPEGVVDVRLDLEEGGGVRARVFARDLLFEGQRVERLEAEGRWHHGRGTLDRLAARSGEATVDASRLVIEPRLPYLLASLGQLDLHVPDLQPYLTDLPLPVSVRARVDGVEGRGVSVAFLEVVSEAASARLSGRATLAEDPEAWRATELDLRAEATLGDLRALLADAPTVAGGITASGTLGGTIGHPTAGLDVHGEALEVDGQRLDLLTASVRVDGTLVRVEPIVLRGAPGTVDLRGVVDLDGGIVREGRYTIALDDLAGLFAMLPGAPDARGAVRGAGAFAYDGTEITGDGQLRVEDAVVDGEELGSLEVRADAQGSVLFVRTLAAEGPWGRATLAGEADIVGRVGRLDTLGAEIRGHDVHLNMPLQVAWERDAVEARGLDLALLGGRVIGEVGWKEGPRVSLQATALDIGLLTDEAAGRLNLLLQAGENGYAIQARAPELLVRGHTGSVTVRALQDDGGIRVEALEVDAGPLGRLTGEALLPWRFSEGGWRRVAAVAPDLTLEVQAAPFDRIPRVAAASLVLGVHGDADGLRAEARLTDLLLADDMRIPGETWLELTATPETFLASLRTPEGGRTVIAGSLRGDRGADWADPARLVAAARGAEVSGHVKIDVPDLALLQRLLPEDLHLTGGAAVDLVLEGPVAAPRVSGSADVRDVGLAVRGDLPPLQQGRGRIVFEGETIRIEGLTALLGYEPLTVQGTITVPADGVPVFDVHADGRNLLLARSRYLRLRANLEDMTLTGPLDGLVAGGRIVMTEALYTRPIDLFARSAPGADDKLQLFSIREGPLATLRFDLHIAGTEAFVVRNNVVRGAFTTDLRLGGTGAVPQPEGNVTFRDTLVKLPLTGLTLKVDEGKLSFPNENPFAPRIDVSAHTRAKGYDLNVSVEGEIPEVEVFVSSAPALAQEDAMVLLTTGSTPEGLQGEAGRKAVTTVGVMLGESLLTRFRGPEDPDEESLLERFSFEVGRDVSRTGQETVETEFRITDRWYLRAERDRFDAYNGGIVWRIRFR